MRIGNVTIEALQYALRVANAQFDGNITFRRSWGARYSNNGGPERAGKRTAEGGDWWHVQLGVKPRQEREQCGECGEQKSSAKHRTKAQCKAVGCAHGRQVAWSQLHHRYRRGQNTAGVSCKRDKYVAAACWHAHGLFFDALPDTAVIVSGSQYGGSQFGTGGKRLKAVDYAWRDGMGDVNVGSVFYPLMASEACDCQGDPDVPQRFDCIEKRAAKKLTGGVTRGGGYDSSGQYDASFMADVLRGAVRS